MWVGKAVILRWSVVFVIVLSAMIWGYFIIIEAKPKELYPPVIGQKNKDNSDHTINDFSLTNQDGKTITQNDFHHKIYVADFFFTNCQGICPLMSNQMARIAAQYKEEERVLLLSHTVKPEEDSIPVLKAYSKLYNADPMKWHFVTGEKKKIDDLARTSYLVSGIDDNAEEDFIHTQFFTLIDEHKRIRGVYDGTDSAEVNKCINDIAILLKE
jgi:protein SCO1/2